MNLLIQIGIGILIISIVVLGSGAIVNREPKEQNPIDV